MEAKVPLNARGDSPAVVRAITDLRNKLGERGIIAMQDPTAFSQSPVDADFAIRLEASDDAEARSVVTTLLEQVPTAQGIVTVRT